MSSVVSKDQIETNGDLQITNEFSREYEGVAGREIEGKLVLCANTDTRFSVQFTEQPLLPDPNKKSQDENKPLDYKLIAQSDCKACHNIERKTIGPAYIDIAKKYTNNEQNIALLTAKIKNGGSGVWGPQVMSAHPQTPEEDIVEMVNYIMDLDAEEEARIQAEKKNSPENLDYVYAQTDLEEADLLPGVIAKIYLYDFDLNCLRILSRSLSRFMLKSFPAFMLRATT